MNSILLPLEADKRLVVRVHRYSCRAQGLAVLGAVVLTSFIGGAIAALPDDSTIISQKGKQFQPGVVSLHPGDRIMVVNDDANFIHHAYVDAPDLAFDSGDQEPAARTAITFPKEGDFTVLCGIHPKMKLTVLVR